MMVVEKKAWASSSIRGSLEEPYLVFQDLGGQTGDGAEILPNGRNKKEVEKIPDKWLVENLDG